MFSLDLPHRYTPRKAPGVFFFWSQFSLLRELFGKIRKFPAILDISKKDKEFCHFVVFKKTHGEAFHPM
jgi:hypothetical protein